MAQSAGAVLGELSSAGVPWLAIDMAGTCTGPLVVSAAEATVVDLADPSAVPVTVNPLEPAPGYPIQAHADQLASLLGVAFGLAEPVAAAIRAGLRRTYTDCGWDMVTGSAAPGAVTAPAVPRYRQFRGAVLAAADDLGYSQDAQAQVRAFLHARLDPLWSGPAGRFLQDGHPVDAVGLLRARVLVTNSGMADDEAASFLAGALLLRLAEQLRSRAGWSGPRRGSHVRSQADPGGSSGHGPGVHGLGGHGPGGHGPGVIVIIGSVPEAGWYGRLLGGIRLAGPDVIVTGPGREVSGAVSGAVAVSGPGVRRADGDTMVLLGRRSAACGEHCRRRPCDGYELHAAGLLAGANQQAWLRLWVQTLVLAFLTGRPVPRVPRSLRSGVLLLSPRRRDCLLATLVDAAVTARAAALRPSYDPRRLICVVAVLAAGMLDAAAGGDRPLAAGALPPVPASPPRAGLVWVIPPLRWLHEIERVNPLGQGGVRLDDLAPPLDFGLAGLPDWPGIRVRDRLAGLRRHPLSMEDASHRELATVALLGDDGGTGLEEDLAATGIGLSPRLRLRHAARTLGVGAHGPEPSWLEVVLSWPDQITRAAWNSDVRRTATG